ncbi:hypothetical protein, partial [Thiolapillus sp.]|uniref:hypothetical protein n=1 Tax=Thiolapillus sp. TaxID=2017437 RepID=UPI003AF7F442
SRWILPSNTMLHHRLSGNGKTRDEFTDKSHRPHRLQTKLRASEKINYPKSGADYGPRMF